MLNPSIRKAVVVKLKALFGAKLKQLRATSLTTSRSIDREYSWTTPRSSFTPLNVNCFQHVLLLLLRLAIITLVGDLLLYLENIEA